MSELQGTVPLGAKVRSLRAARGWSQTELAERMGAEGHPMAYQTVAKIEKGTRQTSIAELTALARVFGTTVADLVEPVDRELGLTPLAAQTPATPSQDPLIAHIQQRLNNLQQRLNHLEETHP